MILFQAKLLKIDSKADNQNQLQHRLIFKSERFDRGLEEMVACSQPIKLDLEHHHLLEAYKSFVGCEIAVPVALTAVDGNVYFKTRGDGLPKILKDITKDAGAMATAKTA
ncbi:hypothetical protein [Acinetobacter haemolyticus]|uniref:hypothetical protein n=1 Tax=Acinetobacter haemolyticus TaxID=29430 RepID=UPI000F758259|nr:hypothetical protein [Acinetobacter haemolyticus]AZN69114.1 hypothetical protein DX910_13540 [Acinetobacter haemolyticus]AZN69125.1 hypothetical protein DX910_13595 [Acinetobacter haemolyticus]MCU4377949.1 hypothetical protein [Acinetobacter haemolyticus]